MKLYGYFRSSAAYRVRIALNLKNLAHEQAFVHLTRGGGEQFGEAYRGINPQQLVPALDIGGDVLTQSLAIVEYLDEVYPEPPLLPKTPAARAHVRALALAIACDIHPLNNLRVLNYLTRELGQSEETKTRWYRHWVESGLAAVERMLERGGRMGRYCHGDEPGLADICLVPQVFNARRFNCDLSACPNVIAIADRLNALPAFVKAQPQNQPDAE
ncbi:MAG: maleylacetoacetate isomerase [Alphaproteobacteria bacterium]|nr:maleylacetoacetate isomerase [Alphaproteobacteria bacterium]